MNIFHYRLLVVPLVGAHQSAPVRRRLRVDPHSRAVTHQSRKNANSSRLTSSRSYSLPLFTYLQVNPEDLSNDLDTKFMTEFYRNMKILSLDLYKKTAALSSQGNQQTAAGPGNFASFSLSSSKSKSNLLGSSLRGKKTPSQITTDLPPISDNSGKIDLSALALESPSGGRYVHTYLLKSCLIFLLYFLQRMQVRASP